MKRLLVLVAATAAATTVGCANTPPATQQQPIGTTGFPSAGVNPANGVMPAGGMQQPMQGGMMPGGMTQTGATMPQNGQTFAPAAMTGAAR